MPTIKNTGFLLRLVPIAGDDLSNGLYQFIANNIEHAQSVIGCHYPITAKNDFFIVQYSSNSHIRIDKTFSTSKHYLSFAHYTDDSTAPKTHVYYQPDGIIHNPNNDEILLNAQDAQQIVQLLLDARKEQVAELDKKINTAEQELHQRKDAQEIVCQKIFELLQAKNALSLNTRDPREELIKQYLIKLDLSQQKPQACPASTGLPHEAPQEEEQGDERIANATSPAAITQNSSPIQSIIQLISEYHDKNSLLDRFQVYCELELLVTETLILNPGSLKKSTLSKYHTIAKQMCTPLVVEEALFRPDITLDQVSFYYERSPHFSKRSNEENMKWREEFILKYIRKLSKYVGRTDLILAFFKKYWLLNHWKSSGTHTTIDLGFGELKLKMSPLSLLALEKNCTSKQRIQALALLTKTHPYALEYTELGISMPSVNFLATLLGNHLFDDIDYFISYLRSTLKIKRRFTISYELAHKEKFPVAMFACPSAWVSFLCAWVKEGDSAEDYELATSKLEKVFQSDIIDADPLAFLLAYTDLRNRDCFRPVLLLSEPANCETKICESMEEVDAEADNAPLDCRKLSCIKKVLVPTDKKDQTQFYLKLLRKLLDSINGLDEKSLTSALARCQSYEDINMKHMEIVNWDLKIAIADGKGLFIKTGIEILYLLIQRKIVNGRDISPESDSICEFVDELHSKLDAIIKKSVSQLFEDKDLILNYMQELMLEKQIHQAFKVKHILSKYQGIDLDTISKEAILKVLYEFKFAESAFSKRYYPYMNETLPEVEQALDLIKTLKDRYKKIIRAESAPGLFNEATTASADKPLQSYSMLLGNR